MTLLCGVEVVAAWIVVAVVVGVIIGTAIDRMGR